MTLSRTENRRLTAFRFFWRVVLPLVTLVLSVLYVVFSLEGVK